MVIHNIIYYLRVLGQIIIESVAAITKGEAKLVNTIEVNEHGNPILWPLQRLENQGGDKCIVYLPQPFGMHHLTMSHF